MAISSTGTLYPVAGNLAELVSQEAIRAYNESFFFKRFAKMASLPAGYNTYQFNLFNSMSGSIAQLTEGVTPAQSSVSVLGVDVTLNQFGGYAEISDRLLRNAPIDTVTETAYEL